MQTQRRVGTTVGLLFVAALALGFSLSWTALHSRPPGAPAIEEQLQAAVAEEQRHMPQRIDEATVATWATASGRTLTYAMSLTQPILPGQVESMRAAMEAANQRRVCANPATRAVISRGVEVIMAYADPAGQSFQTRVTSCD